MAFTTRIKLAVNQFVAPFNIKLDTLTADRREAARIEQLRCSGHFDGPILPLISGLREFDPDGIAAALLKHSSEIDRLMSGVDEPGQFNPKNGFFQSPDAEILYIMVRRFAPRRIVEVGSGNSTRVVRQAIADGGLSVEHMAIDPAPRSDIQALVDRMLLCRFEDVDASAIIETLGPNDILFVDSSHEVRVGNDVSRLFCGVIPALKEGVIVHIHDVFLPFDYPEHLGTKYPGWGEQYLLHMYLSGFSHEIVWPGYYLQRLRPDLKERIPILNNGTAQSFWFRTLGKDAPIAPVP